MTVDTLSQVVEAQESLQKVSFGTDFEKMDNEDRIAFIRQNTLALEDELHEALREVGWKSWATDHYINENELRGELIDALHFLLSLFIVSGMDGKEVFDRYMEKNAENQRRQIEGYTGVDKCPICNKMWTDCHKVGPGTWYCANEN